MPFKNISPFCILNTPKRDFAIFVLPAPTKPANPNISPFLTSKLISLKNGSQIIFFALKIVSPISTFILGYLSVIVLPAIAEIILSILVSLYSLLIIKFPSLNTVILSAIYSNSSSLCDMYIIDIPSDFRLFIISKSLSVSLFDKEDVGSSIIKTLDDNETALAISTICCFEIGSFFITESISFSIENFSKYSFAFSLIFCLSKNNKFFLYSLARKRFSITVK